MFPLCVLLLILLISYLEFIYQLAQANIEGMQALFQYILNIENKITDFILEIRSRQYQMLEILAVRQIFSMIYLLFN